MIAFRDAGGLSGYWSSNCTEQDSEFINRFYKTVTHLPLNTFCVKLNKNYFKILVCSEETRLEVHHFENALIEIQFGFLAPVMKKTADYMSKAEEFAANEIQ